MKKLLLKKNIKKNIYDNKSDKFKLEQNEKIILENLQKKLVIYYFINNKS